MSPTEVMELKATIARLTKERDGERSLYLGAKADWNACCLRAAHLQDERDALAARLAEAVGVVRGLEWSDITCDGYDMIPRCPVCNALESSARHADDCRAARVLAAGEGR